MSNNSQEIEAKFYMLHLDQIITRLQGLGAHLIQPRILETNIRFDLPDGSLRSKGQVLRLRQDTESRLTFKGAGKNTDGIQVREEIEFIVEDFEKARRFISALGYQKIMIYEKFRTTYELDHVLIMLDELPYGNFLEIEAETKKKVRKMAERIDIDWEQAIPNSYAGLFEIIRRSQQLDFQDLLFKNFKGIRITQDDLDVHAADS
jgi:adenylate cyclase, class 2